MRNVFLQAQVLPSGPFPQSDVTLVFFVRLFCFIVQGEKFYWYLTINPSFYVCLCFLFQIFIIISIQASVTASHFVASLACICG